MSHSAAAWAQGLAAPRRPPAAALADWAAAERGRFFPWLAVGMLAGALLYLAVRAEPPAWAGPGALAASAALCAATWRWGPARAAALMLAAAALGFAAGQAAAWRALPIEPLPTRAVVLTGLVRGVDLLPEGWRLVLDQVRLAPDQPPLQRQMRVRLRRGDTTPVAAGDTIELRALLRTPSPPTHPGAWDQQRDAFFNDQAGSGTALNPVIVTRRAPPEGPGARVQAIRDAIGARAQAALPGAPGAVATALLNGVTVGIPAADREAFRDSGLAHLLSVSGLHFAIVMGLFMVATRFLLAAWPHAALHWPTKPIAATVALLAGACFVVLVGLQVPVLRSFAMASLVTLGILVGRRALSMRGLALAACVVVLVAPHEVGGVSLQMSFAAVLALIAGFEALRPVLNRMDGRGWGARTAVYGAGLVLTSLLAGSATAPFGAYHFGHMQVWFILANMVAVPLTGGWLMPLAVLALLLMPFGLEQLAFTPMGWGLDLLLRIARGVASWPAATVRTPTMPGWGLPVFAFGLAWLCLWRTRVRLAGVALIAGGLLSPLAATPPDLLVSNEGRLIALRGPDGYRVQARPGASRFVREAWHNHLGVAAFTPLNEGCKPGWCRMGPVLLLRGGTQAAECTGVTLVVSAEPARGVCPGAALLDRFTVWRDGAHAVWVRADGASVLSDRAARGARPWVPPPPTPRRVVPNLPMAPAEPLPPEMED